MGQLAKIFSYRDFQVRTTIVEGEPWFVAKDVCAILQIRNNRDALARLDADERGVVLTDTLGGKQSLQAVNEYGLYSLVLGSRKPEARDFKRWITHDVIPSIRKHGGYLTPEKVEEALLNPDTIIRLATELKRERAEKERLKLETARQAEVIEEQAERLTYLDEILRSKDTLNITQIAADYGMTARSLNRILRDAGIQKRSGGQWILCAKYLRKGLTKSVTHSITLEDGGTKTVMHTRWTQAGRLLIHQTLTELGIKANQDIGLVAGMTVAQPMTESIRNDPSTITLQLRINA